MTTSISFSRLRNLAAVLVTLSGAGQVAQLWFRDLTANGVAELALGIAYIIIGIGLFGRSRFTLLVAIVVPAIAAARIIATITPENWGALLTARLAVDVIVVLCSVIVLLRVGNKATTRLPPPGGNS